MNLSVRVFVTLWFSTIGRDCEGLQVEDDQTFL